MSSTIPNVISRFTGQVDMFLPTKPNVLRYRVSVHNTLDGAFAGSVPIFTVESGRHYLSESLRKANIGAVDESKARQTRVTFNPDDFVGVSPLVPGEDDILFLRVEDYDIVLGGYLPPSTILVIPQQRYFAVQESVVALTGTAPGISAVAGEKAPPTSLKFALPLYSSTLTVVNLDTTNTLLMSFNGGMVPVNAEQVIPLVDGSITDVSVASDSGNAVDFTMMFTLTRV